MSGWNTADKVMDEDTGSDFPSINTITVAGYMPHDQVPAPGTYIPSSSFLYYVQQDLDLSLKLTSNQLDSTGSTVDTCHSLSTTMGTESTQTQSRLSYNWLTTGVNTTKFAILITSMPSCVQGTSVSIRCKMVTFGARLYQIRLRRSAGERFNAMKVTALLRRSSTERRPPSSKISTKEERNQTSDCDFHFI